MQGHVCTFGDIFYPLHHILIFSSNFQEEGEYMRGKILCYGAIIRSGQANAEQLGDILQKLVSLSAKRSYLAIPAHKIIIEGFQQVCLKLKFIEAVPPVKNNTKSKKS